MLSLLVALLSLNAAYAQQSYLVDWDAVRSEAIDHLVALVKIRSVNPPGNETQVAEYVKAVLAADGIDSELYALDLEAEFVPLRLDTPAAVTLTLSAADGPAAVSLARGCGTRALPYAALREALAQGGVYFES